MLNVTIEELEMIAKERGVPVYVVLDELVAFMLARLN
jgi:hypothetical protein